ncbi:hypothetical protein CHD15_06080 [Salmonella enterica]|nr:hypothetical protein CHD15_06080 [Salmonella enterica]
MLMIIIIIQLRKRQSFDHKKNLVIKKKRKRILQYDSLSGLRFASKSGKGGIMRLLNGGFTKQK